MGVCIIIFHLETGWVSCGDYFAEENANNNNQDVEWNGSLISCVGGTQSIDEMRNEIKQSQENLISSPIPAWPSYVMSYEEKGQLQTAHKSTLSSVPYLSEINLFLRHMSTPIGRTLSIESRILWYTAITDISIPTKDTKPKKWEGGVNVHLSK